MAAKAAEEEAKRAAAEKEAMVAEERAVRAAAKMAKAAEQQAEKVAAEELMAAAATAMPRGSEALHLLQDPAVQEVWSQGNRVATQSPATFEAIPQCQGEFTFDAVLTHIRPGFSIADGDIFIPNSLTASRKLFRGQRIVGTRIMHEQGRNKWRATGVEYAGTPTAADASSASAHRPIPAVAHRVWVADSTGVRRV